MLQKEVADFVKANQLDVPVAVRLLDLLSELGELGKEVLKGSDYGKTAFRQTEEWEMELGDVMFSLICVANSTGINLEKALHEALGKYKKRMAEKGSMGSGK